MFRASFVVLAELLITRKEGAGLKETGLEDGRML